MANKLGVWFIVVWTLGKYCDAILLEPVKFSASQIVCVWGSTEHEQGTRDVMNNSLKKQ